MRRFVIATTTCLALTVCLFALGAGTCPTAVAQGKPSPKDLILGKWTGSEGRDPKPLDFRNDGTFTVTIKNPGGIGKPITTTRTYKWISSDEIETTVSGQKDKIFLVNVKVTKDELTYQAKFLGEVYAEGKYKRAK